MDSMLLLQLIPVLTESVTVQQYLEAETRRQVQSIKVRCQLRCCSWTNSICMRCTLDTLHTCLTCTLFAILPDADSVRCPRLYALQAKAEQRASQLQDAWLAHKQQLAETQQSLK